MVQFFKNVNYQTVEVDQPEDGTCINILPPLKQQEFSKLSDQLDFPLDFLTPQPHGVKTVRLEPE